MCAGLLVTSMHSYVDKEKAIDTAYFFDIASREAIRIDAICLG